MHEKGIHKGMCTVALFEAAKGGLALALLVAGFGACHFLHWGARDFAMHVAGFLHLKGDGGLVASVLKASSGIHESHLAWAAAFVAVYAAFRFTEAYGLWRERTWAEWLALVSGAVYLPFEIYELADQITWLRAGILVVNLGIVAFMAMMLAKSRGEKPGCPAVSG